LRKHLTVSERTSGILKAARDRDESFAPNEEGDSD
jgi:hypothetical protein